MYRVEEVLPRCLRCLIAQTYKRLEVIFVDDCSPDASFEYVNDNRKKLEDQGYLIELIRHDVNSGVAVARNTGLDVASGDFVYFFDADDILEPEAIELMVEKATLSGADIVGIDWYLSYAGKERRMVQPNVRTGLEAFEKMCQGIFKWNLWLFLVRRELYNGDALLRFLPGENMGEDMMLMGKVFLRAKQVFMLPSPLYHYVKTNGGSLTANYSDQHWAQVDANLKELEGYALKVEPEMQTNIALLKLNLKLPLLISPRKSDYERWANWLPEANVYIMSNPVISIRTKLLQKAAALGQWWIVRLYYEVVMNFLYSILYK